MSEQGNKEQGLQAGPEEFRLRQLLASIQPLNEAMMGQAAERQNQLTKPPGSLGILEKLSIQLAGITGQLQPSLGKRAVVIMAGDHGVCAEGVSAFPAEVTPQMVMNMLGGGAAINVFARQMETRVVCVDIGVNAELSHPELISRKVRYGTGNMAREAAMSREEAAQAVLVGYDVAVQLAEEGVKLFATGDMGIGNTTASTAILTALTGAALEDTVGRGTGLDDVKLSHKREVLAQALKLHQPNPKDALDVLAKVGGLEIAGLAGVILGAAAKRRPIVIDGFIAGAAGLIASQLEPLARSYMIASHLSGEKGHRLMLEALDLQPTLHLSMRLGEGTGAVLAFPYVEAAVRALNEMATFEGAGVSGAEV